MTTNKEQMEAEREYILKAMSHIEKLAFSIPAPNAFTPEIVSACIAVKDFIHSANSRAKLTSQVASGEAVCSICNNSGYYCTGYSGLECDGNAPMLERCDCEIGQPTPSPSNVLVEALREITYSHDGYARKKAEQALATYSASTDSVMSLYDGDVKLGDIEMTKPTANEWGKKP